MIPDVPLTMGDTIAINARRYPQVPAYVAPGGMRTHAELHARALRLADACRRAGARHQDRIAILAMNCLEYMEVYSAGWLAGFVTATVNFRLAPPEMAFILGNVTPALLFFETQYAPVVERLRPQLAGVRAFVAIGPAPQCPEWAIPYETFIDSGNADGPPFRSSEQDLACIIHTSGTTGRPKGCMLGQRELRLLSLVMSSEQRSTPSDRVLLVMPLFHVGALGVGVAQHFRGGTIHIHRQFDPKAALDAIARDRITMLHVAPTMFQMLLAEPGIESTDLSSLHTVLYGAAPMPGPVLRRGIELLGNVFMQYYGQTEVVGTSLFREHHQPDGEPNERARLLSVGIPFANTLVKIVDENGVECPAGVPGEVLMKSAMMFRGYWNDEAATHQTIRDGWCHTGDVGKLDAEGFLYLVDRLKDVIISGGENIYSREVEEAVLQHPGVSEVAVIGRPDPTWGEAVCAVVVAKPGAEVSESDLIEHAKTLIASYKKPRSVVFVEELPKLPSGKVNKVALRQQLAATT